MSGGWLYHFCKFYVRKKEGFSYDFDKNGEEWLLKRLAPLDFRIVFDVGANVGGWSKEAVRYFPNARVHAFEISSSTLAKLRKTVPPAVVVNEFGLSDVDREIEYKDYGRYQPVNTTLTNSVFHDDAGLKAKTMRTRVRRGDDYCLESKIDTIDFLKIDVEGAEIFVMRGFRDMLERKSIRIVQFEYGYTSADAGFLMRDYFRFFEELGYQVGALRDGGIKFTPWNYYMNDFCSGPNYVAIRKDDRDIVKLIAA